MTDTKTTAKTPAKTPAKRAGRKPGQQAKVYDFDGLNPAMLAEPHVVDDSLAARTAPQKVRDERQIAMDTVVKRLHNQWIAAERPNRWAAMPKARYDIPVKAVEGFQYIVRRAADYHGVAVKWGTPVRNTDGNVVIVFAIRDRRVRDTADTTPNADSESPADSVDDESEDDE
jgi:hypothetical protein